MSTQALDKTVAIAVALLDSYSFELNGDTASAAVERWLKHYSANWVLLAVIEALYRGRYKAVSVEQILAFWQRRGQASYHFNHEFERLVCGDISLSLTKQTHITNPPPSQSGVSFSNGYTDSTNIASPVEPHLPAHSSGSNPPIEQFTPQQAHTSDFYTKLKAIVQQPEEQQPSN